MLDQVHVFGALPHYTDRFIVTFMPDIDDFIPLAHETQHLTVHLTHQRAGGIHHMHATTFGFRLHYRRYAMGGKHHRNTRLGSSIRNLRQFLDEHRALPGQVLDHMLVVHDLPAHIYRGQPILARPLSGSLRGFENGLYGKNRTVHTRAEASRISEHNAFGHRNLLNVNSVFQCKAGITRICRHNFSTSPTNHRFPRNPRASRMMV